MSVESPVSLLRQAAVVAPTVLPGPLGAAAAAWLIAEAACHDAVPAVAETGGRLLATVVGNVANENVDVSAPNFTITVSTLDKAEAFAREVLALTEQQQTRPDPLVARTWLAQELHHVGACEPGGVEDGQVVCDENCRNLAQRAQDVFLGGPIDWTKEES